MVLAIWFWFNVDYYFHIVIIRNCYHQTSEHLLGMENKYSLIFPPCRLHLFILNVQLSQLTMGVFNSENVYNAKAKSENKFSVKVHDTSNKLNYRLGQIS